MALGKRVKRVMSQERDDRQNVREGTCRLKV